MRLHALLLFVLSAGASAQSIERDTPSCDESSMQAVRDGAERGDAASVYLLARHRSTGACMPGDGDRALALYRAAAAADYPPAFYNLGMLAAGNDDFAEAERWMLRGATLGHRGAELQLGILYMLVPAPVGNQEKAHAWLSLLAQRNEPVSSEAGDFLKQVDKRLSTDARRRADVLAQSLIVKYGAIEAFETPGL